MAQRFVYEVDPLIREYLEDNYHLMMNKMSDYLTPIGLAYQTEVTAAGRKKLLQWLTAVNFTFKYELETICLASGFLDRIFGLINVPESHLQIIGLTALWIASKVEEVDPADLNEMVAMCAHTFPKEEFLHWERTMLQLLDYRLNPPTVAYFLNYYMETSWHGPKPVAFIRCLVEAILCESDFMAVSPARLAEIIFRHMTLVGPGFFMQDEEVVRTKKTENFIDACVSMTRQLVFCESIATEDTHPSAEFQESVFKHCSCQRYRNVFFNFPPCKKGDDCKPL